MLAATEITSKNVEPQQRWLMRLLPIGFTAFLLSFPAGLFVYWITSNLVTLVQNYVIYSHGPGKRTADDKKVSGKGGSAASPAEGAQEKGSVGGQQLPGGGQDPAIHAAKVAKRKRRKKKR
jgi:YidC/Oxa1 family membrane protein insertase